MGLDVEKVKEVIDGAKIYTVREIKEITGISESTLRFWLRTGKVKKNKVGGKVFIKGEDILNMFQVN